MVVLALCGYCCVTCTQALLRDMCTGTCSARCLKYLLLSRLLCLTH